jgi:indolepyruvate decarboxylase
MADELTLSRRSFMHTTTTAVMATPLLSHTGLAATTTTAAAYILARLEQLGVDTLFGVPGATCDPLFEAALDRNTRVIVNTTDLEAGYAADGFARIRGLSAVTVTYGVGTMALLSVIAGAHAERSPIVVLNGGPSAEDLRLQRQRRTLFSHSSGRDHSDLHMFAEVTAAAIRIERAADLPAMVDAALSTAVLQQRPVYIEVAKDLWRSTVDVPNKPLLLTATATGNEAGIAAAIMTRLHDAKRPAILLGIELRRHRLEAQVTALLERIGIPWATTLLAKAIIDERSDGFVGVYGGERAIAGPKRIIEDADALLALGMVMGRQHRRVAVQERTMHVGDGQASVGVGQARAVSLPALLDALLLQPWTRKKIAVPAIASDYRQRRIAVPAAARRDELGVSYEDVMAAVAEGLDDQTTVITDTSLSMYPAAELPVRGRFVCNSVWQAIGFSPAAAIGVAVAAPAKVVVICGDGGFQMTAQAMSTLARLQLPVTVIVLDNGSYGIEQWLLQPSYFGGDQELKPHLALPRWQYDKLAQAMGVTHTFNVDKADALRQALMGSRQLRGPVLIAVRIQAHSLPAGLS